MGDRRDYLEWDDEAPPDPLRLWRDFDGQFRFICEAGHRIMSSAHNLTECPAQVSLVPGELVPRPGADSRLCGADIEYRMVPYADITLWPEPMDNPRSEAERLHAELGHVCDSWDMPNCGHNPCIVHKQATDKPSSPPPA